jgi:hypothetical protein
MRLHMRGLRLWDFLTGEFSCPLSSSVPAQLVISKKTTTAQKERLLADYEDRLASYESQFHTYMTWIDEDARAGSVLIASMEDRFAADIIDFERTHQMWPFLHQKLRISLISFLLFGTSLTLLALSCPLPHVRPIEIRQLHLSFVGPTTF